MFLSKFMCFLSFKMNDGDISIVDYATTHTVLRDKIFFNLTLISAYVSTIFGISSLIEGLGRENIKPIKSYFVVNHKFNNPKIFILWHNILGRFGFSIICRTI